MKASRNVLNDVNRGGENQINEIGRYMNVNLPQGSTKRDDDKDLKINLVEETKKSLSSNSSEDSQGADHTYNPYSFKRLQNAIFKRENYQKAMPKAVSNTANESIPTVLQQVISNNITSKSKAEFLPLQLPNLNA